MATGLPHPVEEGRSGVRERGWGASCREERVEEIPGHTRASLLPGGGGGGAGAGAGAGGCEEVGQW